MLFRECNAESRQPRRDGALDEFYAQFVPDAAVDALIAAGTLCLDEGALRMAKERRHAEV